ncbi:branched-chain amino acid ABC transporter permease [Pseudaminobacter sp. 19-2017]|uniref:Branched-chain amino acid ABC transporter permease n=1 Tax=Pseudaminobacter soli (ex Zhang et al. 2022) TaxID=2831468 RepID=A0A942DXS0_9HYPH|nr:branched-chain amino acid ABC transporter permease [Pseudaminobacter soli]MBS3649829.1 branched-chain amino acid ABC transporter permease [Pseudaminobacter soli]
MAVPKGRDEGRVARLAPLLMLVAVVLLVAGAAELAPAVVQRRITQGLINLVAVVGLYVFVGNSGVLSFGNVAFMGIGAYVSALLTMAPAAKGVFLPDLPPFLAAAELPVAAGAFAGGAAAALVGAVAGFPLMRLSGISASIATFAILVVSYVVLGNWTSVTGGQNSLMGLPIYVGIWTATVWAVVAIVIAFFHQESRSGLLLRASREDEVAAAASGVNVVWNRFLAFVISAFLSGIAGVLLAHFLGTVRVETFYLDLTFLIIAMLVIGGTGSLTGAVSGALVITALTELLRQIEVGVPIGTTVIAAPAGLGDAVLALLMLAIILFRPKGISGGRELAWARGPKELKLSQPAADGHNS